MNQSKLLLLICTCFSVFSCAKSVVVTPLDPATITSTKQVIVPQNFNWQNSRIINFTVSVTDTRFQNAVHVIAIYDGDPFNGGQLLSRGSATTALAFKTSINISNIITTVYIVKTSIDNSTVSQKITITTKNITTSIGR